MNGVFLLILIVALIIDYFLAKCFYDVAEAKGHHEKKYLWLSFLFGPVGYLLVIALPDRGNAPLQAGDALPELNDLPEL